MSNKKKRFEVIDKYFNYHKLKYFDLQHADNNQASGLTLKDFVKENLNNPELIQEIADEFKKMVIDMHKAYISYINLKDRNIIVLKGVPIELKLINYEDNIYIPEINIEPDKIEHNPCYLHPAIMQNTNIFILSNFSELVIYISLCCLAKSPEHYWNFFKLDSSEGLIFNEIDFKDPSNSNVFKELENMEGEIKYYAEIFKYYCNEKIVNTTPPLENFFNEQNETIDIDSQLDKSANKKIIKDLTEKNENRKFLLLVFGIITGFGVIEFLFWWFTAEEGIYYKIIGNSFFCSFACLCAIYSSKKFYKKELNTKHYIQRDLIIFTLMFIISSLIYIMSFKLLNGLIYQSTMVILSGLFIIFLFKYYYNIDIPNKSLGYILIISTISIVLCGMMLVYCSMTYIKSILIFYSLLSFLILIGFKKIIKINISQILYIVFFIITGCFISIKSESVLINLFKLPLNNDFFFGFRCTIIMFFILFSILSMQKIFKKISITEIDEIIPYISLKSFNIVICVFLGAFLALNFVSLATLFIKDNTLMHGFGTAIFYTFLYFIIFLSIKNTFNLNYLTIKYCLINMLFLGICCFFSGLIIELLKNNFQFKYVTFGFSLAILYASIAIGLLLNRIYTSLIERKYSEFKSLIIIILFVFCGAFLADIIRDYLKYSIELLIMYKGGSYSVFLGILSFALLYSSKITFLKINFIQILYFSFFVLIGAGSGEFLRFFLMENWYKFIVQNGLGVGIFYSMITFGILLGLKVREKLSEPIIIKTNKPAQNRYLKENRSKILNNQKIAKLR